MEFITIKVPVELKELANRISRSLEPDTGGYHVFDTVFEDTHAVAEIPTCERYVSNFLALYLHPAQLYTFVKEDYLNRWPDLTPPTMSECEDFCASCTIL